MPRFLAPVNFEVWCAQCGEGLCLQSEGINDDAEIWEDEGKGPAVLVKPCPNCCKKKLPKKRKRA